MGILGRRRSDRLWLAGGALAAVALVASAWFFFVGPQHGQTASLRSQTLSEQGRVAKLRQRLTELRQQNSRLAGYKAELARNQAALPTQPALANFLRQVQAAGAAASVSVSGVTVGIPTAVAQDARAYFLQVSLTADGSATKLGDFLDQMQRVQPRAALITNVSVGASTESGTASGALTMTLTMQIFVAALGGG